MSREHGRCAPRWGDNACSPPPASAPPGRGLRTGRCEVTHAGAASGAAGAAGGTAIALRTEGDFEYKEAGTG